MSIPLPQSVQQLLSQNTHPGLQLDKYLDQPDRSGDGEGGQKAQKVAIEKVVGKKDETLLRSLLPRQQSMWASLDATTWTMKTAGPLALHLSRASALENAGICLHPVYGFAFVPGSGLKGLARAYAETIWLAEQKDQAAAWRTIEDVFGWAPNRDRKEQIKDPDHPARKRFEVETDTKSPEIETASGSVVFHDAWPTSWPKLIVDIVNNHHGDYYQATGNSSPPGDWEDPVPVYFLAVDSGQIFDFALSGRHRAVPADRIALAREWLTAGLVHLGAGGKTNAGYGRMVPTSGAVPVLPDGFRKSFECSIELVTPAFLAGANQGRDDCDLRPATLRGHLRWWWRAMHAGFLSVKDLRELEGALWGTSSGGGAISISLVPVKVSQPEMFDKQAKVREHGLVRPPNQKTTQGLWYLAFGMDDNRRDAPGGPPRRYQRWYLPPGSSWKITLTARSAVFHDSTIDSKSILAQAKSALWLFVEYGGVGAKARKGFGSLRFVGDAPKLGLEEPADALKSGQKLRNDCDLSGGFDPQRADSCSINSIAGFVELDFPASLDVWQAIDALGFSAQEFAKRYKHQREKQALGLPRKIGQPVNGRFQSDIRNIQRHTSPVQYHIFSRPKGGLSLCVTAFVARHLPNAQDSKTLLKELVEHLGSDLPQRFGGYSSSPQGSGGQGPSRPPHESGPASAPQGGRPPQAGGPPRQGQGPRGPYRPPRRNDDRKPEKPKLSAALPELIKKLATANEAIVGGVYPDLEKCQGEDQRRLAEALKGAYQRLDRWDGPHKGKHQRKIDEIKKALGES